MRITKVFNNNVVGSIDQFGRELVVMGKGIGFQKKKNDVIDDDSVEKIYKMPRSEASQFEKIVEEMPYEHIALANEIIGEAREKLGRKLSKNIYITLTDHLSFAIVRKEQGIEFENALLREIKRFYHPEFQIGLRAIELVEERIGIKLSEDEAGFIALHIANAEVDGNITYTIKSAEIIQEILDIVKNHFMIEIDEESISYDRFITHLKYLIYRLVKKTFVETEDKEFYMTILDRFPEATTCAKKVKAYLDEKLGYEISEEELMYLTIHIERIVRRDSSLKDQS